MLLTVEMIQMFRVLHAVLLISVSQEEEEEETADYNYGNYSYNIYQNTSQNVVKEKWNTDISHIPDNNSEEDMKSKEMLNGVTVITSNELVKDIPKYEDSVVEDLNLVVDKDIVHSNNIVSKEFETDNEIEFECSDKQARIQHADGTNAAINDKCKDLTVINELSIPDELESLDDKHQELKTNIVETTTDDSEIKNVNYSENDLPETTNIESVQSTTDEIVKAFTENQTSEIQAEDETAPGNLDDDFGDFEDFQFTSASENCQVSSIKDENPWESDCVKGPDFGDFTANFDVKEPEPVESITEVAPSEVHQRSEEKEVKTNTSKEDDDDDFGDFDDFRSSDNAEILTDASKVASTPDVNLWSLSSSDNDLQILDSINTVLASIFPEQIPEPENEFVGRLESFLRETWGYMVDIEVRQPYMVNWNNSLGQKTLLKALCIDSRNIVSFTLSFLILSSYFLTVPNISLA